jgi:hypothetical protein
MKFKLLPLPLFLVMALTAPGIHAAVSYTTPESIYTQNFDSLNGVTTWTNNSTLTGWYARTDATASITAIGSNTGTTTTGALYSFGVAGTNLVSERSFGYASSNGFTGGTPGTSKNYLGFNVNNNTGETMTTITIGYDGEQWRKENNANSHGITVEYSLDATSLTSGTWTSAGSALTFTSPLFAATTATALDGNASANSVRGLTNTIGALSWSAGSGLWIRFVDLNDSGSDHQLAIDNVTFTAVPEPGPVLLGGLGLLALLRRRRIG